MAVKCCITVCEWRVHVTFEKSRIIDAPLVIIWFKPGPHKHKQNSLLLLKHSKSYDGFRGTCKFLSQRPRIRRLLCFTEILLKF